MDEYPLAQKQQKENKGLMFLEVGLIELFFVAIVLILLFGILNYFNILKLSAVFPNYLGFLPHRHYQQSKQPARNASQSDAGGFNNKAMKQSNNVTIVPTASLTDSAKQTLANFLPTVLNPSAVPQSSKINLFQSKGVQKSFSMSWDTKDGTATAILSSPDGKEISQLYLSFPYPQTVSLSIDSAKKMSSQFLTLIPKGQWACKTISASTNYCENFWEEANGTKRGVGVQEYHVPSQTTTSSILFCEHAKDSKLYSWKSCIFQFSQTGVK